MNRLNPMRPRPSVTIRFWALSAAVLTSLALAATIETAMTAQIAATLETQR